MELPEKVYKYRIWENGSHKNLLLYNELYLASPKDYNDPFDCRIPPNFMALSKTAKDKYINDLAIKEFEETKKKGLDFNAILKKLEDRVFNDTANFQKDVERIIYDDQDKYYGILSLSRRWNSILMWSHYADCHKGFCVGFWTDKLIKTGFFGKCGKVDYMTKFPELIPFVAKEPKDLIESNFIRTHTKSVDWTYEDEYRFFANYYPKVPKPFERIIQVLNEVFAEVILGINISDADKEEIIAICKGKRIPVYMAEKKEFMFDIDRKPIHDTPRA